MPAPKPTRTPAKATPRTRAIAISVVFLVNLAIGLFLHAEWMTDCDRAAMRFEWWRIAARDRGCARKLLLNAGFFAHGTLPPGADAGAALRGAAAVGCRVEVLGARHDLQAEGGSFLSGDEILSLAAQRYGILRLPGCQGDTLDRSLVAQVGNDSRGGHVDDDEKHLPLAGGGAGTLQRSALGDMAAGVAGEVSVLIAVNHVRSEFDAQDVQSLVLRDRNEELHGHLLLPSLFLLINAGEMQVAGPQQNLQPRETVAGSCWLGVVRSFAAIVGFC